MSDWISKGKKYSNEKYIYSTSVVSWLLRRKLCLFLIHLWVPWLPEWEQPVSCSYGCGVPGVLYRGCGRPCLVLVWRLKGCKNFVLQTLADHQACTTLAVIGACAVLWHHQYSCRVMRRSQQHWKSDRRSGPWQPVENGCYQTETCLVFFSERG